MSIITLYPSKDAYIVNHSVSSNYMFQGGKSKLMYLGSWDFESQPTRGWYAYQSRILLQFDLPAMPVGGVVKSARLKFQFVKQQNMHSWNNGLYTYNTTPTLQVHKILQPWDEGTGDGNTAGQEYTGTTWTRRTASGYNWPAYGGYFNLTPAASQIQTWDIQDWEFDIKSLVQDWYTTPSGNFGLITKLLSDNQSQGGLLTWSRESGTTQCPVLELEISTPPEKPRGLSPNYGSFICQDLAHTMHFKWNFIDTNAPIGKGKSDVVFIVDVSSSMQWRLPQIRANIDRYLDRLTWAGIDWQAGLVWYCDVHAGQPVGKSSMTSIKSSVLSDFDRMPRYTEIDYPESGLEAITLALATTYRENSKVSFMVCTDAPMHTINGIDGYSYRGYSQYDFQTVMNQVAGRGIVASIATNTHCGSYTQLRGVPNTTGGQYLEESSNWGDYLSILYVRGEDESQRVDEGDSQSKADLRIWKIETNGSRTLIWSYTVNGITQDISLKGLGISWEEGSSYEWDVTTYDQGGLASPASSKGKFTYIIDVNTLIGIPMFNEPVLIGTTVNKNALIEVRTKLYDEVRKYSNIDPAPVMTLFTGQVVPSKSDMKKFQSILNQMLAGDGLDPSLEDLISTSFGVSDIQNIRIKLMQVAFSSPDTPANGIAKRSQGMLHRPISISSSNTSATDLTIDVKWSPSEYLLSGWLVDLSASQDTDINYYKLYHEEGLNLADGMVKQMLTEVYLKAEQVTNGMVFIPDTGRTDFEHIWYTSHDMNGRASLSPTSATPKLYSGSEVILDKTTTVGTVPVTVSKYIVESQMRSGDANRPDPAGTWSKVYEGASTVFTHTVSVDGSYWYRVKAINNLGINTDWTYSVDTTYVKR